MGLTIIPSGQAKVAEALLMAAKVFGACCVIADANSSLPSKAFLLACIAGGDKALGFLNSLSEGVMPRRDEGINPSEYQQTPTPPNIGMRC